VSSPGQLEGKIALVTGSSRGIGRVIASYLAELGAEVGVHGTTPTSAQAFGEAESLDAVARAIEAESHRRIVPVHGDLTVPRDVERSRRGSVIHLARLTYSSTVLAVISVWRDFRHQRREARTQ